MKHMKPLVIATLLLLGISGASAQSLGDYARAVRKDKAEPSSASRHYDNDNLPTGQPLSVVGPPPAADANAAPEAGDAKPESSDKAAAANPAAADAADAERQKAAEDWKMKIDEQQKKLDSLNHDLDLAQREYRLRVASQYDSEANRIQNAGQWGKENAQYRTDTEAKQKAIEAAQQELNDIQDQAHKAGIEEKDKDSNQDADNNQDSDKDKDKKEKE
ncbi:MAG: hypothetical protein WCB94_05530 [Terriglobales bacterium]